LISLKKQEGSILFLTVMILVVIGILSVGLLNVAEKERRTADLLTENMQDFYSAENCMDEGLKWLEVEHASRRMPAVEVGAEDKTVIYELLLDANFEETSLLTDSKCKLTVLDIPGFAAGSEVDDGSSYGESADLGKQKYFKILSTGIRDGKINKSVYAYVLFSL
jgi:Tfp pilus assembly protein PilX